MSVPLKSLVVMLLLAGLAPARAQAGSPGSRSTAQAPKIRAKVQPRHRAPVRQIEINTASKAALAKIPGLDAALATQIIAHRPYLTKEHLVLNGVLPQPLFLSIRSFITCVPPKNWSSLVHSSRSPKPAGK